MTTTDLQTLEDQVLAWIQGEQQPVTTAELLEKHRGEDLALSGEALRRAVWSLVDRGIIRYDDDWRLSIAPAGGQ